MQLDPSDIVSFDVTPHKVRHADDHATKHAEQQGKSDGVSFADQLDTATKKATPKHHKKVDPNKIFLSHTPPKGETTAAVPGHADYRDILSGPRNGMYVNTSGNERNGEAFVLVHRHGVEYHIYGTGSERQVIRVAKHHHHHHHKTPPVADVPNTGTDTTTSDSSSDSDSSAGNSTVPTSQTTTTSPARGTSIS